MRRFLVVVLAALSVACGSPAWAQAPPAILTAELTAQFQASLVRERRLADERLLQAIASAETRLREARAAFDAAGGDRQANQAALDACRADYVRLVTSASIQDAAARIQVEAFRAEITGTLPQATPELVSAYQQFADGDRTAAWAVLETLLNARAAARVSAARTVSSLEVRALAQMRDVMRVHGEATAADVLRLWDQVVSLNPNDVWAQVMRANLEQMLGNSGNARAAAEAAVAAAHDDHERSLALSAAAQMARAQGALDAARDYTAQNVAMMRGVASSHEQGRDWPPDLLAALSELAELQSALDDRTGALATYLEAEPWARQLYEQRPSEPDNARNYAILLEKLAEVQEALGQREDAHRSYAQGLRLSLSIAATFPDDLDDQYRLGKIEFAIGSFLVSDGKPDDARIMYETMLQIARRLVDADASNRQARRMLTAGLAALAGVQESQGAHQDALANASQSADQARALAAEDANDIDVQLFLVVSLKRYADLLNASEDNGEAASARYAESLDVARRVVLIAPNNGNAQATLAASLDALAEWQMQHGDLVAARSHNEESLIILRRRLATGDALQPDLVASLALHGNILRGQQNEAEARRDYQEALTLARDLARRFPQVSDYRTNIAALEAALNEHGR